MFKLLVLSALSAALSLILLGLSELVSLKEKDSTFLKSPFECGFDPLSWHRKPFSVHFFFTCIVFLIFDLEILILLPWVSGKNYGLCATGVGALALSGLMLVFLAGLMVEWNTQSLDWKS